MKKNCTELVFILDRSGSMSGLEADTIGGFNSLIEKQKNEEGTALVTTVLFNHEMKTVHDRVDLAAIAPMKRSDYVPAGSTALLDAIGKTIDHISMIHQYIRKEDIPDHTIFVITTDGMENASRRYTLDSIKSRIEEKKKLGWEFLFLGSNIDAISTAACFGIDSSRAVSCCSDAQGTQVQFEAMEAAISCCRSGEELQENWKDKILEDNKNRSTGKSRLKRSRNHTR